MKIQRLSLTLKRFKPYVRWFVLALIGVFIIHTLRIHWQQILMLRFTTHASAKLVTALGIMLLAHIWSGWVWYWIVRLVNAPVLLTWSVIAYLKTNLGKYLPGNVWHFVGRIQYLKESGTSIGVAVTGVMLEPVLMSVAALIIVMVSLPSTLLQALILVSVMVLVHPRLLNPVLERLTKAKIKQSNLEERPEIPTLNSYPIKPLIGEIIFVLLRGAGFIFCFASLGMVTVQDTGTLLGAFSFAWLLGLVVPGAPGGLGVFEATALTILTPKFPVAMVLGAVALYRLNSTLAEVLAAGLAVVDERWNLLIDRQSRINKQSKNRDAQHGMVASQVTSTDL